jgi:hypothetical protein
MRRTGLSLSRQLLRLGRGAGPLVKQRYIWAMGGRFTYKQTWEELVRLYRLTLDQPPRNTQARYNVCPTRSEQPIVEFLNGFSLANPKIRDLYDALTGDKIQEKPFLEWFRKHKELGATLYKAAKNVSQNDLEKSYSAPVALTQYLWKKFNWSFAVGCRFCADHFHFPLSEADMPWPEV